MAKVSRPYRPEKIEKGSQVSPVNVHEPKQQTQRPKPPPAEKK